MRVLFLALIAFFIAGCIQPGPESYYDKIDRKDEFMRKFPNVRMANELVILFDMGQKTQAGNDFIENEIQIADYEDNVKLSNVRAFLNQKGAAPFRLYEKAIKSGKGTMKRYSGDLNAKIVLEEIPFNSLFTKGIKNCLNGDSLCFFNEFPLLTETDVEGDVASMMINFVEVKAAFNNFQDDFTPTKIIVHTATYTGAKLSTILDKIPAKTFENSELKNNKLLQQSQIK